MLSGWIAVFDGRPARLDRPGLVQYRTCTEYSASHRPSTRARDKGRRSCAAPSGRRRSFNLHALNGMLRGYFGREGTCAPDGGERRSGARSGERDAGAAGVPPLPPPLAPALYRSGKWFPSFPNVLPVDNSSNKRGGTARSENLWKLWSLTSCMTWCELFA